MLFVERSYWILKRPSHGKLKLANSCWETSKSWQTRTFTLQTRVKSQHTVIRSKANVKCHSNHANKALVAIGWHLPTHVCQSFTHQIQVYQHEKVGENRSKFYLSPTVCQRVCRLFLCRSHTPTWVCQHEFANLSLPTRVCQHEFANLSLPTRVCQHEFANLSLQCKGCFSGMWRRHRLNACTMILDFFTTLFIAREHSIMFFVKIDVILTISNALTGWFLFAQFTPM